MAEEDRETPARAPGGADDDDDEPQTTNKRRRRKRSSAGRKETTKPKITVKDENDDGPDASEEREEEPSAPPVAKEEGSREGNDLEPSNDDGKNGHGNDDINDDDRDEIDGGGGGDEDDAQQQPPSSGAKRKRKRKRKKKNQGAPDKGGAGDEEEDRKLREKMVSMEHTVYVEGIPFDCTEEDVREFFVSNGCPDVLQLRLPKWQDSGRLRGYGHVVFDTTESRKAALDSVNGKHLGRRYVTVREPHEPRPGTTAGASSGVQPRSQPDQCRTVFVKNLPYDATDDDVSDVFRVCGKIVDGGVRLARNYQTHASKGFGYVEFKNPEGALAAVQKASKPFGLVVKGRPCFVDYEEGSMKGSYRTGEGRLWSKEHTDGGGRGRGAGGGRFHGGRRAGYGRK